MQDISIAYTPIAFLSSDNAHVAWWLRYSSGFGLPSFVAFATLRNLGKPPSFLIVSWVLELNAAIAGPEQA
jgi:hypothetical protein